MALSQFEAYFRSIKGAVITEYYPNDIKVVPDLTLAEYYLLGKICVI